MRRLTGIIVALAIIAAISISLYFLLSEEKSPPPSPPEIVLPTPPPPTPESARMSEGSLIGEKLLHAYASEGTTVREDLQAVSRVCLSFRTLVKTHANMPIGCNLDLADALRGKNPYKQRFIPDAHPVFNKQGELIDRWKTPLHIHTQSAGQWDIRSAGPDKKLWTQDDLQITPNGKFTKGKPKTPLNRGLPSGQFKK